MLSLQSSKLKTAMYTSDKSTPRAVHLVRAPSMNNCKQGPVHTIFSCTIHKKREDRLKAAKPYYITACLHEEEHQSSAFVNSCSDLYIFSIIGDCEISTHSFSSCRHKTLNGPWTISRPYPNNFVCQGCSSQCCTTKLHSMLNVVKQ